MAGRGGQDEQTPWFLDAVDLLDGLSAERDEELARQQNGK